MYKVILFDLDGTLTESGEGITKSVQYALERIGKPEPDLEKLKVFIGPPLMEMFMQYAQIDEATAKQAVEIYRERYSVTGIFENAVYPGIENMLAQLEKKGYILAVASSKPEVYVRQILDHFGLTRYFTEIGGSELNGRRTNKTEVIEDVLKRLNMDKHRDQVIMVGDKEHDVYGARKAGLECIAVSFGYGTEEELKQAKGYPAGIHFGISQIVAGTALAVFARTAENSAETYYNYTIFLTGLTGILAMIPALYFYRRDKVRRIASGLIPAQKKVPLSISETVLLLLAGAGFAQYGNFLMAILQSFINSTTYQESMTRITEGKSLLMMIFWMGIIAPAAEEMIFRWLIYLRLRDWLKMPVAAVISGLIFGIYHGNIVQGIYASILGTAFAWILEMSGNIYSSMLLHMGANIWSLLISEYGVQILILIYLILLISVVYCLTHFEKMCSIRKKKRMI